jgi:hypothetical protein
MRESVIMKCFGRISQNRFKSPDEIRRISQWPKNHGGNVARKGFPCNSEELLLLANNGNRHEVDSICPFLSGEALYPYKIQPCPNSDLFWHTFASVVCAGYNYECIFKQWGGKTARSPKLYACRNLLYAESYVLPRSHCMMHNNPTP